MFEKLFEKLLDRSCKRNYKIEKDGKCYSKKCLVSLDPTIRKAIQKNGCYIFQEFTEEEE